MHSFLQSSTDLPEDQYHLHIHPDASIGIDEIRQLQVFLSKKPPKSKQNVVIIHDAHLLTIPAQHALLKTLEEPPGDSQIYLLTPYPDQLLPTILSRIQQTSTHNIPTVTEGSFELIQKLLDSKTGDRINLLEAQKFTRQTLSDFLDQAELYIHNSLSTDNQQLTTYNLISTCRKYLKANCNLRLILTHIATNL